MMKRTVALTGEILEYEIRRSARARRTSLTVYPDGSVVVTLTLSAFEMTAERFVKQKEAWLIKNVSNLRNNPKIFLRIKKGELEKLSHSAKRLIHDKVLFFKTIYNSSFNRITIRNQRRQWGSCSPKKNISYNVRIALLPTHLAELVIVHELCHLQEMNHSKTFWSLVGKTIPYFKQYKKELKQYVIA